MRTPQESVAVVTGATSGIGRAIATGLAKWGAHVTLVVRSAARGKAAMNEIRKAVPGARLDLLEADLSSQRSIRDAAATFLGRNRELHILVNCAGVFLPTRVITGDGVEATLATNYVGYWLLTDQLLPALKKGAPARIVNVASKYGGTKIDFTDLNFDRRKYSYFKATPPTMLARVLFTQEVANRLEGSGVTANTLHPGLVRHTQLLNQTGGFFRWFTNTVGARAEKGADTALWLATAPDAATFNGMMFANRRPIKMGGQGADPDVRRRLWDETERLVAASGKRPTAVALKRV